MSVVEPKITQCKDIHRLERIGTHSHIRGLGLNDALDAKMVSQGIIITIIIFDFCEQDVRLEIILLLTRN